MSLSKIGTEKEWILKRFAELGYELSSLVESLFERNATPVEMNIPSSPENGYIIDYDGKYVGYFKNAEIYTAWDNLINDYPEVYALVDISMPVYDPDTGIVIIFTAIQYAPLAGAGWIIAYSYDGNALIEITRLQLWIS
jgi:hypothetical protein